MVDAADGGAPRITVATVVLNAADDLPITLESIIAQDCPGVERLVVDGGSWDGTHEVLARYSDAIDRVVTVEDAGIFHAMNEAARLARGEFILFMNAGDRFHQAGSLRALVERMPPGTDIAFGDHVYTSGGVQTFRPARDFAVTVELLRTGRVDGRWLERFPAHQATLTRTELLRRLRYDTALRVCADHDFLLRAAWDGARTAHVDEIVAEYSGGGFSSRNAALLRLEFNAVYRAFSERPDAVDRLLHGESSPFAGQLSPFAGGYVSGVSPQRLETPELGLAVPHRLLDADGARLMTPRHAAAKALRIAGINRAAGQLLRVRDGETEIGAVAIGEGEFAVAIPFVRTIAPGRLLGLAAGRASAVANGRPVALAIRALDFDVVLAAAPLPIGEAIRIHAAMDPAFGAILGRGWWAAEAEFAWSAETGELSLGCRENVSLLRFTVLPNPVIAGQALAVVVNGEKLVKAPLAGGPNVVEVPVSPRWRSGGELNAVSLVPSRASKVGADPRTLGIALIAVELS
jgi:hypothetical protein